MLAFSEVLLFNLDQPTERSTSTTMAHTNMQPIFGRCTVEEVEGKADIYVGRFLIENTTAIADELCVPCIMRRIEYLPMATDQPVFLSLCEVADGKFEPRKPLPHGYLSVHYNKAVIGEKVTGLITMNRKIDAFIYLWSTITIVMRRYIIERSNIADGDFLSVRHSPPGMIDEEECAASASALYQESELPREEALRELKVTIDSNIVACHIVSVINEYQMAGIPLDMGQLSGIIARITRSNWLDLLSPFSYMRRAL
jgi:hypothetical protein